MRPRRLHRRHHSRDRRAQGLVPAALEQSKACEREASGSAGCLPSCAWDFWALRCFLQVADETATWDGKSRRPSLRNIIVSKRPVFLNSLAALLADWTTELRPSRMALVKLHRHQSRTSSRSLRSVLETTFISGMFECVIHGHSRPSAPAALLGPDAGHLPLGTEPPSTSRRAAPASRPARPCTAPIVASASRWNHTACGVGGREEQSVPPTRSFREPSKPACSRTSSTTTREAWATR